MFEEIKETLGDHVEEIFLKYHGNEDGGLPPELYLEIDGKIELLAEAIINGLRYQKGE